MQTDYKFWFIRRDDNGFITEAAIRFYEGDITTENEMDRTTQILKPVTRYRRSKRLAVADLQYLGNKKTKKEYSGEDAIIYTPEDFGIISTDDELRSFLNKELAKDTKRTPIKEQKWQL